MLQTEAVRKHFGDHRVLNGIDLHVGMHEIVCLIGASGSGKSTLLRCLNLLETVDDGSIWLDGAEITDPTIDVDDVRRRIQMVFQSYNLFPHMSVLKNITLGPRTLGVANRRSVEAEARELLDRFGLAEKADAHPDGLSGGQQQRVALIRAIAMRPDVLLLDEITSALDPVLVGGVLDVVRELKSDGMTVVMATHEMSFAREVADNVVYLDGGTVCEQGSAEQVLGSPRHDSTQRFLARFLA